MIDRHASIKENLTFCFDPTSAIFAAKPRDVLRDVTNWLHDKVNDIMIPHIWKHFGNIVSMGISWELEGN